jgi:hypothetical protein
MLPSAFVLLDRPPCALELMPQYRAASTLMISPRRSLAALISRLRESSMLRPFLLGYRSKRMGQLAGVVSLREDGGAQQDKISRGTTYVCHGHTHIFDRRGPPHRPTPCFLQILRAASLAFFPSIDSHFVVFLGSVDSPQFVRLAHRSLFLCFVSTTPPTISSGHSAAPRLRLLINK